MSGINLPKFEGQPEHLHTRVSAAVRLYDPFTPGGGLIGTVMVQADSLDRPPIRNLSGWYVFTGLPAGSKHTVRIDSEHYMPHTIEIQAPASASAPPVQADVLLLPKASYPFSGHVTLIRAIVVEQPNGPPVQGAAVEAQQFEPEDTYIASLADNTLAGTSRIKLSGVGLDALASGVVLLLKDTNTRKLEYVRLTGAAAADGYPLSEPLRYPHQAGTAVYAVKAAGTYTILTDGRGEFAVPVTRLPLSRGFVALTVSRDGFTAIHRDIQCEEGQAASLGVLTLLSI